MNGNLRVRMAAALGTVALVAGGAAITAPAAHANQSDCNQRVAGPTTVKPITDGQSSDIIHVGCLVGTLLPPAGGVSCRLVNGEVAGVPAAKNDAACRDSARP